MTKSPSYLPRPTGASMTLPAAAGAEGTFLIYPEFHFFYPEGFTHVTLKAPG